MCSCYYKLCSCCWESAVLCSCCLRISSFVFMLFRDQWFCFHALWGSMVLCLWCLNVSGFVFMMFEKQYFFLFSQLEDQQLHVVWRSAIVILFVSRLVVVCSFCLINSFVLLFVFFKFEIAYSFLPKTIVNIRSKDGWFWSK